MSVLGNKDSERLETVRYFTETDPMYYSILNRPVEDVEQRTIDLYNIMSPARGLQVRATSTPSKTVEVAGGWYLRGDTSPLLFPQSGVVDTVTITDAAAGDYRIDLVYFDVENGTIAVSAGTATAVSWVAAWASRGTLPTGGTYVPLAYLYVPDSASVFYQDGLTGNTAGRIQDARLAFDTGERIFDDAAASFAADTSGAAVGSSTEVARANHRHDVNVDATAASLLYPDSPAAIGSATTYARRDHKHRTVAELVAGNFLPDILNGLLGSANTVARGDHQHPLNVSTNTPSSIGQGTSNSAGTSSVYSRNDHRHPVIGLDWDYAVVDLSWRAGPFGAINSGALGFEPKVCFVVAAGSEATGHVWSSTGFSNGLSVQKAVGSIEKDGDDYSQWACGIDESQVGGSPKRDAVDGYIVTFNTRFAITQWSSSNVRFSWTNSTGLSYCDGNAIILGQS